MILESEVLTDVFIEFIILRLLSHIHYVIVLFLVFYFSLLYKQLFHCCYAIVPTCASF